MSEQASTSPAIRVAAQRLRAAAETAATKNAWSEFETTAYVHLRGMFIAGEEIGKAVKNAAK